MPNTHSGAPTRITADHGAPPALIDFKQLSAKVCMGRSRIYKLIGEGNFPSPVKIGASSRWIDPEIDAYIAQLAADRDSENTGG
jgi:prophage regulatory protein